MFPVLTFSGQEASADLIQCEHEVFAMAVLQTDDCFLTGQLRLYVSSKEFVMLVFVDEYA